MLRILQHIPFLLPSLWALFWMVILLCRWKHNPQSVKIGLFALLFVGMGTLIRSFFLTEMVEDSQFYLWEIGEVVCLLNFFSCMILYIKTLTERGPLTRKDFWVFLPGLLVGGTLMCISLMGGKENMSGCVWATIYFTRPDHIEQTFFHITHQVYGVILVLMANITFIYARYRFSRYEAMQTQDEVRTPKLNRAVLSFLAVTILFAFFIFGWRLMVTLTNREVIAICFILWACALFYWAYNLSQVNEATVESASQSAQPEPEQTNDSESWIRIRKKLLPVFNRLMEEEHLFLRPNLRLDDLVLEAQSNRNYIFHLLKEEHGCGFSEYINRRRIEYAKTLIHVDRELTQEQIAEKCGFTHSSSFSRTFKQYTGTTFREWLKSVRGSA